MTIKITLIALIVSFYLIVVIPACKGTWCGCGAFLRNTTEKKHGQCSLCRKLEKWGE